MTQSRHSQECQCPAWMFRPVLQRATHNSGATMQLERQRRSFAIGPRRSSTVCFRTTKAGVLIGRASFTSKTQRSLNILSMGCVWRVYRISISAKCTPLLSSAMLSKADIGAPRYGSLLRVGFGRSPPADRDSLHCTVMLQCDRRESATDSHSTLGGERLLCDVPAYR